MGKDNGGCLIAEAQRAHSSAPRACLCKGGEGHPGMQKDGKLNEHRAWLLAHVHDMDHFHSRPMAVTRT